MDKTQKIVRNSLTTEWQSSRQLVKLIDSPNIKKKQVNSALYKMFSRGEVRRQETQPPMWKRCDQADQKSSDDDDDDDDNERDLFHVFIDGDNSACLDKAAKYADKVRLYCAVSPQYNHYVPKEDEEITFKRVESTAKSAADVQLGVWMTQTCESYTKAGNLDEPLTLLIVSKDNLCVTFGFILAEQYKHVKYEMIRDSWQGLREWLE